MANGPSQDDFDFYTVGVGERPFSGYNSESDPTVVPPTVLVEGSKNVFKDGKGNISVRPGLKRYGSQDSSSNGTASSYEWETSVGNTRTIRVLEDGQFQVLFNDEWLTLQTFDKTRFVFTDWWANEIQQELLVFVNGENAIYSWSGGIVNEVGPVNTAGVMANGATPTTAMTAAIVGNVGNRIYVANNGFASSGARSAFILNENPENGDLVSFTVANTAPFQSASIIVAFVTVLGSPSSTIANVLIGATKEQTAARLLAFFKNPGANTATQVGIADANTVTGLNFETYEAVNSLETVDGEPWRDSGFTNGYPSQGSSISVNGVQYDYTLITDKFLVQISGTPATGTPAFQTILTSQDEPADDYACDFAATITNQLIVGSYSSPAIYLSANGNYLDFENGGDLVAGDPDQIVLDELPRGVIVVNESAYVPAGSGAWYICTPNTPLPFPQEVTVANDRLVIIKVEKKVGAAKSAALAHEFIGSIADTIIYLGQDHQLRIFGTFKDVFSTKYPAVSEPVKRELEETDFTGGQIRAIGDNIYLVAPVSGKVFIYQQRDDVDEQGLIVSERIWQMPQEWNISRIAIINDKEYGYSNQSPETYQLWNTGQWYDDTPSGTQAYECIARFGYWQFRERTKLGSVDKVYVEGYMPANTPLTATLRNDYLGSTSIQDIAIGTADTSPRLYTEDGVLVGDHLIGQELVGGSQVTGTPKFRAIPQYKKIECFEYQIEFYSFAEDTNWSIVCMGTNGGQVINKPVYLLKG